MQDLQIPHPTNECHEIAKPYAVSFSHMIGHASGWTFFKYMWLVMVKRKWS
jgi:hypothetical protein